MGQQRSVLKGRQIIACFCVDGNAPVEREKLIMQEREGRVAGVMSLSRQKRVWTQLQVDGCVLEHVEVLL